MVVMLVVQRVLLHAMLPRIMGCAVGLHPLLVCAVLLIGSAVAGVWGELFGIALAGVVASGTNYVHDETA